MAFTYDPTTNIGKVRLFIPDRVEQGALFTDAEIETFLDLEGDNVWRAAALALETVAGDEALTQKVQKIGDIQTDGAKLQDSILKRAAGLRKLAEIAAEAEGAGVATVVIRRSDSQQRESDEF